MAGLLQRLQQQNFGPNDSVIASGLMHPQDGLLKMGKWFQDNVNTAAGIPNISNQDEASIYAYGPSDEQKVEAANNLSGLLQTSAFASGAAPASAGGTLGTFIGPKSMGWNQEAANTATKLLDSGADPAQVWKEHIIGRMPDGKLFSEISDKEANMLPLGEGGVSYVVDKAISHNDLLNNYPDLSNLYFSKGNSTYYSPEMNHIKIEKVNTTNGDNPLADIAQSRLTGLAERLDKKNMLNDKRYNKLDTLYEAMYSKYPEIAPTSSFDKSSSLHELQHAIQNQEGWARGGSPDNPPLLFMDEINKIRAEKSKLNFDPYAISNKITSGYHVPEEQLLKYKKWEGLQLQEDYLLGQATKITPMQAYRRLTGEAQARATQDRMNMNMQQRRDNYPLAGGLLSDIPLDQLINRYR